jgi:hypothetical protein
MSASPSSWSTANRRRPTSSGDITRFALFSRRGVSPLKARHSGSSSLLQAGLVRHDLSSSRPMSSDRFQVARCSLSAGLRTPDERRRRFRRLLTWAVLGSGEPRWVPGSSRTRGCVCPVRVLIQTVLAAGLLVEWLLKVPLGLAEQRHASLETGSLHGPLPLSTTRGSRRTSGERGGPKGLPLSGRQDGSGLAVVTDEFPCSTFGGAAPGPSSLQFAL